MRGLGSLEAWCWRRSRSCPISPDRIMYPFQQITQLCKGNKFQYWTLPQARRHSGRGSRTAPSPDEPAGCRGGGVIRALRPGEPGKSYVLGVHQEACEPRGGKWLSLEKKGICSGLLRVGGLFQEGKMHVQSPERGRMAHAGTLRVSEGTLCRAAPAGGWRWGLETSSLGPDRRCVLRRWPERDAGRWGRGRGEMGIREAVRWNWQIWW